MKSLSNPYRNSTLLPSERPRTGGDGKGIGRDATMFVCLGKFTPEVTVKQVCYVFLPVIPLPCFRGPSSDPGRSNEGPGMTSQVLLGVRQNPQNLPRLYQGDKDEKECKKRSRTRVVLGTRVIERKRNFSVTDAVLLLQPLYREVRRGTTDRTRRT